MKRKSEIQIKASINGICYDTSKSKLVAQLPNDFKTKFYKTKYGQFFEVYSVANGVYTITPITETCMNVLINHDENNNSLWDDNDELPF